MTAPKHLDPTNVRQPKDLGTYVTQAIEEVSSLDEVQLTVLQAALAAEQRRRSDRPPPLPPPRAKAPSGTFSVVHNTSSASPSSRLEQISKLEGFRITVAGSEELGPYPFERRMRSPATVQQWKALRFLRTYPDRDVKVLLATGAEAPGNMRLQTVIDSYKDVF